MEVHHHSHTSGKKWTHYFWEFLMLFLAVFCGFLAEYQLEHKIEKERARQYVHSFYEDLKADTAKINLVLKYDAEKISGLNNIMTCHQEFLKDPGENSCLGILVKHSKTTRTFEITDRTLRQLANAGGFRLLRSYEADSILSYENRYRQYKNFESTIFQTAQDNVRNTLNELADFRVIAPLQQFAPYGYDTISGHLKGPLMYTDNKILVNKWFNELVLYLRVINGQSYLLNGIKSNAIALLGYFRSKYHFE